MARKSVVLGAGTPATARTIGRLTIRRSRAALRARVSHRWWAVALDCPGDLRLRPAEPTDATAWLDLIEAADARPERAGVAASPLGGAADSRVQWIERYLDLRASARRGRAYVYLVERDGDLIGEALALVDLGTSSAHLLVWLRPDTSTAGQLVTVIDVLGRHVLSGPNGPLRARCSVAQDSVDVLAALQELGYTVEGVLTDPPRVNRTAVVTSRAHPLQTSGDVRSGDVRA